ncbi:MAG: hypothetical protein LBL26_01680 [Peptococcaceae bacterium]|nr:hypothetical protein [Peptococcaceae bacterium]
MVATAQNNKMTLITVDEDIRKYDVDWIW